MTILGSAGATPRSSGEDKTIPPGFYFSTANEQQVRYDSVFSLCKSAETKTAGASARTDARNDQSLLLRKYKVAETACQERRWWSADPAMTGDNAPAIEVSVKRRPAYSVISKPSWATCIPSGWTQASISSCNNKPV
ncbi:MAG: hypothetical protein OHK0029_02530 [Armatimonadaceae bacterium]